MVRNAHVLIFCILLIKTTACSTTKGAGGCFSLNRKINYCQYEYKRLKCASQYFAEEIIKRKPVNSLHTENML